MARKTPEPPKPHTDEYRCTDCGKKLDAPGTCAECLAKNNPE